MILRYICIPILKNINNFVSNSNIKKLECNKSGHNMMCSGYLKIRYYFEISVFPYAKICKAQRAESKNTLMINIIAMPCTSCPLRYLSLKGLFICGGSKPRARRFVILIFNDSYCFFSPPDIRVATASSVP